MGQNLQSISDNNQKSSKSHINKNSTNRLGNQHYRPQDEDDDFEDELDDIVLDRVYNANPSHYKLNSRILTEKEEREL